MIEFDRSDVSLTMQYFYINFSFYSLQLFIENLNKINIFNFVVADILN